MIVASTRFVPRGADAITLGPFILMRPGAVGDTALLAHERVHQSEQLFAQALWVILLAIAALTYLGLSGAVPSPWWLLLVPVSPWWGLYLAWPKFRLEAELRGYRRQIALGGISTTLAAHYIATRYRLEVSFSRALELVS